MKDSTRDPLLIAVAFHDGTSRDCDRCAGRHGRVRALDAYLYYGHQTSGLKRRGDVAQVEWATEAVDSGSDPHGIAYKIIGERAGKATRRLEYCSVRPRSSTCLAGSR